MYRLFSWGKIRAGVWTGGVWTALGLMAVGGCATTGQTTTALTTRRQHAPHRVFWAWCWSAPAASDTNLYPMIWIHHADYAAPAKIAAETRNIPRGKVAVFLWNGAASLLTKTRKGDIHLY